MKSHCIVHFAYCTLQRVNIFGIEQANFRFQFRRFLFHATGLNSLPIRYDLLFLNCDNKQLICTSRSLLLTNACRSPWQPWKPAPAARNDQAVRTLQRRSELSPRACRVAKRCWRARSVPRVSRLPTSGTQSGGVVPRVPRATNCTFAPVHCDTARVSASTFPLTSSVLVPPRDATVTKKKNHFHFFFQKVAEHLCDSAACRQTADAVISKLHSRPSRRSEGLMTAISSSPVASPRKSNSPAPTTAAARTSSSSEYPIRVSPSRTGAEAPRIEIDDAPPRTAASPVPARHGSPELERLLRENKSHLRQVNAELVATRDPARQRALLDERTLFNNTITALTEQVQQLNRASAAANSAALGLGRRSQRAARRLAEPQLRRLPAPCARRAALPRSAAASSRTTARRRGSAAAASRSWCAAAAAIASAEHTHSVHVGGVDCFMCDSCTASASAPPALHRRRRRRQTSSSKGHRHTISYTTAAASSASSSAQGSPSAKVPPIRLARHSSAPADAPRAPSHGALGSAAPHDVGAASRRGAAAARQVGESSVSSTKLADGESIWGKGAAPWESFKAPREGRRLSDRLATMVPADKPKKGSRVGQHAHSDRCTRCRVERGVNRVARDDGTVVAVLCTSCRISLNFRAAIGE
jgi:hypothetical protein